MNENDALITVCLLAAFADAKVTAEEQKAIQEVVRRLAGEREHLSALYEKVARKQVSLEEVAAALPSPEAKAQAVHLARQICACDGDLGSDEQAFLDDLMTQLGVEESAGGGPPVDSIAAEAEEFARLVGDDKDVDQMIQKYAMTTAAIDLLPKKLAKLGIFPAQIHLVYRVGKRYGYDLDRGHIKEFLAALGISYMGQMVEVSLRGIIKRFAGRMAGKASDMALTFGTTYAIGHAAKDYYAGGRKLSPADLRKLFEKYRQKAKTVSVSLQEQIENLIKSRT